MSSLGHWQAVIRGEQGIFRMTDKFDLDAHLRDAKTQADLRADQENITRISRRGGSADRGVGSAAACQREESPGAPLRELPRGVSTIGAAPVPRLRGLRPMSQPLTCPRIATRVRAAAICPTA